MFGSGYGNGISVVLVMVLTETIRRHVPPILPEDPVREWHRFAAVLVRREHDRPGAPDDRGYDADGRWSGPRVATLACSAVFEAPVARKLTMYHRSEGTAGKPVLRQAGAVVCTGCFVVLLAWGRQRLWHCDHRFQCHRRHHGRISHPPSDTAIPGGRSSCDELVAAPNPGSLTPGFGGKMIVLFQRQLAPYRVSLFNSLNDALDGQFTLVLTRPDPTANRLWTVPWSEVRFRTAVLRGHRLDIGRGTWEVSRGVGATLDGLKPQAVVLGGWDVHACWAALRWARRRGVPLVGWVESSQQTGLHRGILSSTIRRRFLSACSAAIVPGVASEAFVRQLAPALPCHYAPNSVDAPDLRAIGEPSATGRSRVHRGVVGAKGADLVLAAAPQILQLFPRLIVAGDGPLRSDVTALAARLPGTGVRRLRRRSREDAALRAVGRDSHSQQEGSLAAGGLRGLGRRSGPSWWAPASAPSRICSKWQARQ